jgi:uncharacterized circularly permuted ATP-grasp superfamily protein
LNFEHYQTDDFYDELFDENGLPRQQMSTLVDQINALSKKELKRRQKAADLALYQQGITFSVYGNKNGTEKIMPFDLIPRVIQASEWQRLEKGLVQRVKALNLFIDDVYHEQKILKDKIIPAELVLESECYSKQCEGLNPPKKRWIHITGSDLVRDGQGEFFVLEDNLRCPSGVSYLLENRMILKRTFPHLFKAMKIRPVSDYTDHLYGALKYLAGDHVKKPSIILLTPGIYNSAYYEHAYLAQQMGIPLAQGSDLVVMDGHVMLRTTKGFEKVDVIYRRIDDAFLDPNEFREDSLLGVPGIMDCLRQGTVALANAPGTGIADDKAVYAYVPEIIKYYLDEEPIINNVPTYVCHDPKQCQFVLANLDTLVVKAVNLSGGYGMLIGPHASAAERRKFAEKIKQNPRNYIAQPTLALSRSPTMVNNAIEGRHVDMRPYVIYGESIRVIPGGLTRVALTKGSLVVNSSQGGGTKDTWIIDNDVTVDKETNHA